MRRTLSILLSLILLASLAVPALAVTAGQQRVVIGADLSEEQVQSVYGMFGISRGSVQELYVTNGEERDYLEGLVSEDVIGHSSISCVYIQTLDGGAGLSVSCENITWCTEEMYKAALMTAGVYDAQVKVAAPWPVSGTAALTGIYKAYESITGTALQQQAKTAATDELVITAQLADQIDDMDAVSIVGELKLILDETRSMDDAALREQIVSIADQYGYTLSDGTVTQLVTLCRTLEGLPTSELQSKVEQFQQTLSTFGQVTEKLESLGQKLSSLLGSVTDFFRNLFGG